MPRTLFEKIWENHVVISSKKRTDLQKSAESPSLIYIDRHLIHEVTSPQAFSGLKLNNRRIRRPDLTFATMDHNVPTDDRMLPIVDETSRRQVQALSDNCKEFGVTLFDLNSQDRGIVHIIEPELQESPFLEQPLHAATVILLHMAHLVLLHSVLALVKLNMFWLLNVYGWTSPKHLQLILRVN